MSAESEKKYKPQITENNGHVIKDAKGKQICKDAPLANNE